MANMAMGDMQKRKIKVNRMALLTTLKTNRDQHEQDYQQAMKAYRQELAQYIRKTFAELKKNLNQMEEEKVHLAMTTDGIRDARYFLEGEYYDKLPPESHTAEYDTAIAMIEWDTSNELELSYAEFNCLVRDDWEWKPAFSSSVSEYLGKVK